MDISGAVVVDLRAGATKDAYPVNEDAAGICNAINTYGSANVSVIYDSTTGKASHVYLVSTGTGYTVTAASDTQVSLTQDGTYGSSVTAPAGTTIYVKLTSATTVSNAALTLVSGTANAVDAIYSYVVTGTATISLT